MKHNSIRTFAAAGVAVLSLSALAEVNLWQVFPALVEQPTADMRFRAMLPKGQALVQMADNEYESLVIGVENRTDDYLDYTVDASELAKIPGMTVEVRSSWETTIGDFPKGGKAEQAMGATGYGTPGTAGDPFLPCPPDRKLGCPSYENRSFWVTLHSTGVKAGTYKANVKVTSAGGVTTLPVTVEVWPFRLADKLKAFCYHWDYATKPEVLKDEVEHCVNTFMVPFDMNKSLTLKDGVFTADFGKSATHQYMTAKLAVAPDAYFIGSYGFFGEYCDWAQRNKVPYMSDKFKEYFKKGIQAFVAEMKALGLGYDRYWLQHWDEPNGGSAKKVLEMAPLAKEADPNVQWFFDHMSSWAEIKALAEVSPMMGIRGEASWSPEQKEFYDVTFKAMHKKPLLLQFKQKGIYRNETAVNHFNRYRSWRTWQNHWDGFCTFAHAYCVYFWGSDHPVSVRQWEVSREGYEDYKYFELYLDLAEKAGKRDEAVKYLDDLVQAIIGPTGPGTFSTYDQEGTWCQYYPYYARQELAKRIAALAGKTLDATGVYAPQAYTYALPGDAKEVALRNQDADIGGAKFEPVNVDVKFQFADNHFTGFPLQFALDDYVLNIPDILTEGEEYELLGTYKCPADKSPRPRLIISDINDKADPFVERDGKKHDFSIRFKVPANVKDLNLVFKEIRNVAGETIENRCDLEGLTIKRYAAGGKPLPKAQPAPKLPPKSFAKGLKGEFKVRGAAVRKGHSYVMAVEYASDHTISQGLVVKAAKKHGAYPHDYAVVRFRPTDGRTETAYASFKAIQDEDIIAMVGRKDEIQFDDANGVRRPAKLEVKSVKLYEVSDGDEALRLAARQKKNPGAYYGKVSKLFGDTRGNVKIAHEVKDGKRFVTLYNIRPERSIGFLVPDKGEKPFGWRPVCVPAASAKTIEVPADGKTTEFWSLTRDCTDQAVDWTK